MSELRRVIIDTDTGSDDVWAIIEALRAESLVRVEAITTVCGNLPLSMCTVNAMHAEDAAGTYFPPVYKGAETPLQNAGASFYADYVHGSDGLSDMCLPLPERSVGAGSAADAIVDLVMGSPEEIEIITLGPLTNLALAIRKEPKVAENIKMAWILGGAGGDTGNMTKAAEYNIYVDPEAAETVLHSGIRSVWVTWDAFRNGGEITFAEADRMAVCGDPAGEFCARCTRQLREYYFKKYGRESFGVIDTVVMTVALYPEIISEMFPASCAVELAHGEQRGHFFIDREAIAPNALVCTTVNTGLYKKRLFHLLGADG